MGVIVFWAIVIAVLVLVVALGVFIGVRAGAVRPGQSRAAGSPGAVPTSPPYRPIDQPGAVSRRRLLRNAIFAIGGAMSIAMGYPVLRYFIYPALKGPEAEAFTQIADASEVPVGVPTFITYEERMKDGWTTRSFSKGAWVVTRDGREFTVFDPHCTHLGCAYYWNPDRRRFLCPCHDGVFDEEGNVISGPPPRPLDRLENKVEDGALMVGRVIRSMPTRSTA